MKTYESPLQEAAERFPQTLLWNDSCGVADLNLALRHGATGATSNPVIVGNVLRKEMADWKDRLNALIHVEMPDATDEEIIAAAKTVRAHEFISEMPDGYYTQVNERGSRLSQGQKQLIAFARTLLSDPKILVLDEATSSIDTRTEVRIQKAFARMMQGRTSFIVAHRLSTIREADVILVMKDGHIVEQGSHDQLLAQGGFYAKLYNSQFEGVQT